MPKSTEKEEVISLLYCHALEEITHLPHGSYDEVEKIMRDLEWNLLIVMTNTSLFY